MALDTGIEYAIIAAVQTITIPSSVEGRTLVNDSKTQDIFWRERDPSITPIGNAATLIAAPFFCSRLKPGETVWKTGITLDVVASTGETPTLRVVPGRLEQGVDAAPEAVVLIDSLDATASWANSTDASGIATSTTNVPSHDITTSLSINKSGTSVVEGSYGKDLASTVDASIMAGDSNVVFYTKRSAYTDVSAVFVRIGTDSSNYMEYAVDPVDFTTSQWVQILIPVHEGVQTGTGLDLANIDYVAFGVTMDALGNTITAILFNALEIHSVSTTELTVTSDVGAAPVRVQKVGTSSGGNWPKDKGASTNGTPRGVTADDSPEVVALNVMTPTSETGLVSVITGTSETNGWQDITLTSGATAARFSLTLASAFVTASTAAPADLEIGVIYPPGIPYTLITRGRTKIWFRHIAAAAEARIHVADSQ